MQHGADIDQKIADIQERLRNLKQLLDDPHPGLCTWTVAYERAVDSVLDFY